MTTTLGFCLLQTHRFHLSSSPEAPDNSQELSFCTKGKLRHRELSTLPQLALLVSSKARFHLNPGNGKELLANAKDLGLIPGLGRSHGGGHGNPLQYSCLENPMNRGAWRATIHRMAKSLTRLKRLSTCNLMQNPCS